MFTYFIPFIPYPFIITTVFLATHNTLSIAYPSLVQLLLVLCATYSLTVDNAHRISLLVVVVVQSFLLV